MTTAQIASFHDRLERQAAETLRKVQEQDKKEAKARGFKSVDAMYRANRRAAKKAILESVCGGDESLYQEAFGN